MAVNLGAVGTERDAGEAAWTSRDTILYASGVGAGAQDPATELAFTTENTRGVEQLALPTFAGRALLHEVCESEPARFGSMTARFSSPVVPGRELTVHVHEEDRTRSRVSADGATVLDHGRFERRI